MSLTALRTYVVLMVIAFTTGCTSVTLTPEAQSVMVHRQVSTLLSDCQRLTQLQVTVDADKEGFATVYDAEFQALSNARHIARTQYGADTIAVVGSDRYRQGLSWFATVHAIAFKCS
jgi:hypothetical protein